MAANIGHLPIKFGYKQAYGWNVINRNRVFQVNFQIWPLTYLHDLWLQNIVEANIGRLPSKFGYKQAYGWIVINPNRVLQVNFHIWPHLTFDLIISWRFSRSNYQPSLALRACGCIVIQVFVSVTHGRNLDPLVSLHLGGLDKNKGHKRCIVPMLFPYRMICSWCMRKWNNELAYWQNVTNGGLVSKGPHSSVPQCSCSKQSAKAP